MCVWYTQPFHRFLWVNFTVPHGHTPALPIKLEKALQLMSTPKYPILYVREKFIFYWYFLGEGGKCIITESTQQKKVSQYILSSTPKFSLSPTNFTSPHSLLIPFSSETMWVDLVDRLAGLLLKAQVVSLGLALLHTPRGAGVNQSVPRGWCWAWTPCPRNSGGSEHEQVEELPRID